jgi:hypothetical protein
MPDLETYLTVDSGLIFQEIMWLLIKVIDNIHRLSEEIIKPFKNRFRLLPLIYWLKPPHPCCALTKSVNRLSRSVIVMHKCYEAFRMT